jgi:hypothetical protein
MNATIPTNSIRWYRAWLLLLVAAFVATAVVVVVAIDAGRDGSPASPVGSAGAVTVNAPRFFGSADSLAHHHASVAMPRFVGSADALAARAAATDHEPVYGSADSLAERGGRG